MDSRLRTLRLILQTTSMSSGTGCRQGATFLRRCDAWIFRRLMAVRARWAFQLSLIHLPPLRPGTAAIVHVPIPCLGQNHALRGRQAKRRNIACPQQQASDILAAFDDPKLSRLLDRVDGVPAGDGEAQSPWPSRTEPG